MRKVGMIFQEKDKITIEYDNNAITVGQGEFKRLLDALWKGEYKQ